MPITQERLLGIVAIAEHYQRHLDGLKREVMKLGQDLLIEPEKAQDIAQSLITFSLGIDIPAKYVEALTTERVHFRETASRNARSKRQMESLRRSRGEKVQTKGRSAAPEALDLDRINFDLGETEYEVEGGVQIDPTKPIW